MTQFEFWPIAALYGPLIPYLAWQAIRHKSLTVFTAVNPGMAGGGFAGESKATSWMGSAKMNESPGICAWTEPSHSRNASKRIATWQESLPSPFPIVLKPDVGERGKDVRIVHNEEQLAESLPSCTGPYLAQEFIGGQEYGVFYIRDPRTNTTEITSITTKQLPSLQGDGARTVEELVLYDTRAVAMEKAYRAGLGARWSQIPEQGKPCAWSKWAPTAADQFSLTAEICKRPNC